jgi:hypothetical protein
MSQYDKDYYAKHRERLKVVKLKYYYGRTLTPEQKQKGMAYQEKYHTAEENKARATRRAKMLNARRVKRLEEIDGRPRPDICELCGSPSFRIVFDHDHATGKFRGWICYSCNVVLGHMKDNKQAIMRLVAYLEAAEISTADVLTLQERKSLNLEKITTQPQ